MGEDIIQPLRKQQSFLRDSTASTPGLPGFPSQTLEIRAAKGPLTFPRVIPNSTFKTSLERVPEGSKRTAATFPLKQAEEKCKLP